MPQDEKGGASLREAETGGIGVGLPTDGIPMQGILANAHAMGGGRVCVPCTPASLSQVDKLLAPDTPEEELDSQRGLYLGERISRVSTPKSLLPHNLMHSLDAAEKMGCFGNFLRPTRPELLLFSRWTSGLCASVCKQPV